MSAPMTGQGIVTTEKIGITEIVKERETEAVTVIEHVIEVGTVAVTMSVIERETMVVIVLGTGRGTMKLVTITMGVLMIGMNRNMRGIDMVKGTMIMPSQRMIWAGMNNLSRVKSCQMQKMTCIMITTSIAEAGDGMITWMFKVIMAAVIYIMAPIAMAIIWRRMITTMIVEHLSRVKIEG